MKRIAQAVAALVLVLALAVPTLADGHMARVRVVHASPDAPNVDILVNDAVAFSDVAFKAISDYAELEPGTYNVKVVPTGTTEPVVIEADLTLEGGQDYTVVALGELANIEPLVLSDDNALPAAGMTKIRFVHASPNAPNVDIRVKDGPVLFENVAFKEAPAYVTVDAGTYDLEVVVNESGAVALEVPGLSVSERTVYTVFAMGLAGGEPALEAVPSADATPTTMLPETGGAPSTMVYALAAAVFGIMLIGGGLWVRQKAVVRAE